MCLFIINPYICEFKGESAQKICCISMQYNSRKKLQSPKNKVQPKSFIQTISAIPYFYYS